MRCDCGPITKKQKPGVVVAAAEVVASVGFFCGLAAVGGAVVFSPGVARCPEFFCCVCGVVFGAVVVAGVVSGLTPLVCHVRHAQHVF